MPAQHPEIPPEFESKLTRELPAATNAAEAVKTVSLATPVAITERATRRPRRGSTCVTSARVTDGHSSTAAAHSTMELVHACMPYCMQITIHRDVSYAHDHDVVSHADVV